MALARYQAFAQDANGNVISAPSVEVRRESDNALISLFSDRNGGTPIGNPFVGDGDGYISFHVAGGAYKITVTSGGFSRVFRYVAIGTYGELDIGSNLTINAGGSIDFGVGNAVFAESSGMITLTTAIAGSGFTIRNTDAGNSGAPLVLFADSASPAVADLLANILGRGRDSGGNVNDYGYFRIQISSPTNGAEGGVAAIGWQQGGAILSIQASANNFYPVTNDSVAIGSAGNGWSDAFFAFGAVVRFADNASPPTDVTLTHSSGDLALAGGSLTLLNTGLHLLDTNASHDLIVKPGSDLTADRTLTITTGDADRTLTINSSATISGGTATAAIEFVIDGGGTTLTTGVKGDLEIPFGCTINGVTLVADQSGSVVVDIWKDTYANYPPVVGDSITASAKPTISSATKSQDNTLTGWTTSIAAGDTLRFNVDSVTTITRVTVSLKVTKT